MLRTRSFFWIVASLVLVTVIFAVGKVSANSPAHLSSRPIGQTRSRARNSNSPNNENESEAESPPVYFYGTAAIPSGFSNTDISSRFITPNSRIFLTVDTTAVPGSDVALPEVMVRNKGNGYFT